jgi:nicotinate-nucleotide adenylyltransferase
MNNKFSEEMLFSLRESVKNEMGEKRYFDTLEVEKMAERLGEIYAPNQISMLRAAALLHDITKERTTEEHIAICENAGETVSVADRKAPKMFHSRTAALVIPTKYPDFNTPEIISAVRYHTTGRADMTLAEKIIYLADYIDMSRKYGDCVALRDFFFDFDFENTDDEEKIYHLNDTLIMSYNLTIKGLLEDEKHIDRATFEARNFLILER